MLAKGKYRARAQGGEWGKSPSKGTRQIVVDFELTDEVHKGERINYIGYITPNTQERVLESLRICGWKGDDVTDLLGLGDNEVELVVDHEAYEGSTYARVQFVNRIGSGFKMKAPMSEAEKKQFAAEMRGLAVKSRSAAAAPAATDDGGPKSPDDIPF
jgi:hypothetical protein